jgi:perosamine synthetase
VNNSRLTTNFDRIGMNYKLSNILSAVGLVQMKHIDELLNRRLELTQNYMDLLEGQKNIVIPKTTEQDKHSRQSFCIYLDNRDALMKKMREMGIEVQIGTYSLHMHPAFAPSEFCRVDGDMSGSSYAFEHCLALPLYHEMSQEDQGRVVEELISCVA